MRINKFIANSGYCSRRDADKLIEQGRVKLNDKIIMQHGVKISPEDVVAIDNRIISLKGNRYYLALNKPVKYLSTVSDDRGRKTVLDLIPNNYASVYPVGRLDYMSEGLLLLSNDGEFTYKVTHPKFGIEKEYKVWIDGFLADESKAKLEQGVTIDGKTTSPAKIKIVKNTSEGCICHIIIHEGRNRQVRKMFELIGRSVTRLVRVRIGQIDIENLKTGEFRSLTREEINGLVCRE